MRQMAEVTRPTDAREAQERAVAEVAERARMEAAAREQARQQAMEAMRGQQQRQLDQEQRTQALASANRTVERELYTMLKEGGDRCLSDPQTPQQLATTLERTLGEHDTKLKELGLTRERLGEQVKSYVENIRQDSEGFRQRMEPQREQQHERGVERGHDRGGFGFSR